MQFAIYRHHIHITYYRLPVYILYLIYWHLAHTLLHRKLRMRQLNLLHSINPALGDISVLHKIKRPIASGELHPQTPASEIPLLRLAPLS